MNGYPTPGLYTRRALAQPAARPRLTSVTGFVGLAPRGPLNSAQRLENWGHFETIFGDLSNDHYLAPAVYGFFANGGKRCYAVRVADSTDDATRPLSTLWQAGDAGSPVIEIAAANEGVWGDELGLELSGSRERMILCRLAEPAAADSEQLRLTATADLFPDSPITLVDARQARIESKVAATLPGSRVRLAAPPGRPLPAGSPVLGHGLDFAAVYRGRTERFSNLSLDPDHPRYLPEVINGDAEERSYVARMAAGSSILVRVRIPPGVSAIRPLRGVDVKMAEQSLLRSRAGRDPALPIDLGFYTGYDAAGYFPGADPQLDGYQGLAALETVEELSLVTIPDLSRAAGETPFLTGQRHMLRHCEQTGGRLAILDSPRLPAGLADPDPVAALVPGHMESLGLDPAAVDGALYFPWLRMAAAEGHDASRFLPPCGFVAGIFARTDALEGAHRSPANEPLTGVFELQVAVDDQLQSRLNPAGVNCLRAFPGRGIRIWGARTLSPAADWRYVAVRRTLLVIREEIRHRLRWAVFEPSGRQLQLEITASLISYLNGLFRANVLAGSRAEEAYFVKCDQETNPPEVLARGEVVAEIGFAPLHPAEFIVATIKRTAESIDISAAA